MHKLPNLNYDYIALEPHIDAKTMEIHHTKHHQGYVNKLNAAIEGLSELEEMPIEQLLENLDKVPVGKKDAVRNNGGGHANHSLFWETMTPGGNKNISSKLQELIDASFGNLENCIKDVSDAAATQFGSGWGWLALDNESGELEAVSTKNQDSLYLYGKTPLLGIDVWEHAYYLNYQNRRPDYVEAFWNVVDWGVVSDRLEKALG